MGNLTFTMIKPDAVRANNHAKILQHLVDAAIIINCVFTDHQSEGIIEYCNQHSLPMFVGNPRNGKAKLWLDSCQIEFENLLSMNYLFILETDVLDCVTNMPLIFMVRCYQDIEDALHMYGL